jgi:hypothetical protein
MIKKIAVLALLILCISSVRSQSAFGQFIYGKLTGEKDTLTGYFRFEQSLSSMGQQISQKKEGRLFPKSLWAKDFLYFDSDSLHLERFGISTLTGDLYVMLPRIIDGKIQVYEYAFDGGPLNMIRMEHYYFIKNRNSTTKVTRRNFKKVMLQIITDNTDLLSKVEKEALKFSDLKQIIITYNSASQENQTSQF